MKKLIIVSLIALALVLVFIYSGQSQPKELGSFLTASVTNSSSSIGITDTLVYSPSNLQYFYAYNRGGGTIDCGWTTTSTLTGSSLNTGLRFENSSNSTSSEVSHTITDGNLLGKYMHCIANTTTSLNILKY